MSTSVKAALLLLVFACEVVVGEWPTAKLTIQVVDETGSPLGGTETRITFEKPVHVAGQWGSSPVKTQKGKTDSSGSFSATDAGSNHISYGAVAAGYYPSNSSVDFEAVQNGKWSPWDSIFVLTLRKIIHPVPMYAKRLETKLPVEAWPVGFDLVESDWVAPYGRGRVSDFVFAASRVVRTPTDFTGSLKLTFSNKGDGIISVPSGSQNMESEFRLPREAPEFGYVPERVWQLDDGKPAALTKEETESYFYRVRTILDEKGHVASALYGKIHGDIKLYVGTQAPKPGIGFAYYLNPDGTRNMEFDPKQNLFSNLRGADRLREP